MSVLGLDLWVASVLLLVVLAGAAVQSLVGLGVGLVAAPVMALIAPDLVPVTLLVLALLMPLVTLSRERAEVDWGGLGWALLARVPGTAAGVWLVAVVSVRALGILVGSMVLLSVLATWRTVSVPVNRFTLIAAGLVSGVTGTATSIGGPPMALLYQHRSPVQIRTTLAVYFLVGAALSLAGLALTGQMDVHAAGVALALVPGLVLGTLLAGVVRRRFDPGSIRAGVLWVCGLSAAALLARSVL